MQYRLNERLALRGWDDHPFALQDLKAGSVSFLDEAAFRALSFCNGVMDVDSPLIPDMYRAAIGAFAARKAVEPCEAKRPLSPEQRLRVFPTRFVANVYWSITGRCNMRCRHCFMSAPQAKYGEMSHDKCMDIIRQMGGLGVPSVWLSGGEPLVREDFLELVDALTEQGINIARIYTNGLLVDEALLDELDGRGVHPDFFLSFDGVGWHDWLRGVEGAEQMAIDRIRLLRARGFPVAVASAFHRNSIGSMAETMALLAGLDVGYWVIEPMLNSGNWLGEDDSLNLGIPELAEIYLEFVDRYYEAGSPINILIRRFFKCGKGSKNFMVPHGKHGDENDPCCLYARDHLYIAADGKLLPCIPFSGLRLQDDMPDLNGMTIAQALSDSLYARLIETPVSALMEHNPLCASCKRRKDCGGGCRATAIMFSGKDDYLGIDPAACTFFKGDWDDRIRSIADRHPRLKPQGESGERAK